jgi:hypothetical protein
LCFCRGHNITFISAFKPDFHIEGLEEIAPEGLATYVKKFMSQDLVGNKMRGEEPMPFKEIVKFSYEV